MKKLRILALVHDHLVPPEDTTGIDVLEAEWKMEYDVIETLREMSHSVRVLGLHDELGSIRPTVGLFKPHIVFNLMEAFAGVTTFDLRRVSPQSSSPGARRLPRYAAAAPHRMNAGTHADEARKFRAPTERVDDRDHTVVALALLAPRAGLRLGSHHKQRVAWLSDGRANPFAPARSAL